MRFTFSLNSTFRTIVAVAVMGAFAVGCGGASSDQATSQPASKPKAKEPAKVAASDKGIGPIDHVELGPIEAATAEEGRVIFESKCAVCHKFSERYVGPALADVTKRRKPEWIMNMILNPDEMIKEDETAKGLFIEYLTPMTFQNVTQDDAEALLTYFRAIDEGQVEPPVETQNEAQN
jgi:mono/diheme cytochrome c family protein